MRTLSKYLCNPPCPDYQRMASLPMLSLSEVQCTCEPALWMMTKFWCGSPSPIFSYFCEASHHFVFDFTSHTPWLNKSPIDSPQSLRPLRLLPLVTWCSLICSNSSEVMSKTVGREKPVSESASSRQRTPTTFPIDHILT